jgi:hypothetical protein
MIPDMCFSFINKNRHKAKVQFVISQQPEFKFIHCLFTTLRNDPLKTYIDFLIHHERIVNDKKLNNKNNINLIEKTSEECLDSLINENYENNDKCNEIRNIL